MTSRLLTLCGVVHGDSGGPNLCPIRGSVCHHRGSEENKNVLMKLENLEKFINEKQIAMFIFLVCVMHFINQTANRKIYVISFTVLQ